MQYPYQRLGISADRNTQSAEVGFITVVPDHRTQTRPYYNAT